MTTPTLAVAALAGVASFASPCMLPVVPAFLAQLGGTTLDEGLDRATLFRNAALFVLGFSLVFAALGVALNALVGGAGTELLSWLSRIAGAVVVLLGLHLTGLLEVPALDREYSLAGRAVDGGAASSLLFGGAFAVGWTPCVGPILGSTLALAAASPVSAFPLLVSYSLGLGAPFLLVGLFPRRGRALIERHGRLAERVHTAFGVVLIGVGVLVFTGRLDLLGSATVPFGLQP